MTTQDPVFEHEFLPLFRRMIQNACVNTGDPESGNEDRNIEVLRDYLTAKGLEVNVLHSRPGRGNLVCRLRGEDPEAPSLAFMGHVDVVPASDADWRFDPFSAEVADGHVWGRGAVDMLCWTAAQAVGFAQATSRRPQTAWPGDLVFIAVADEEASGRWGAQFLTENHWELVRADYMVTELGGFFVDSDRGPAAFCTVGEKGVAWVKLTARGTPGHGSMPYRSDNAALKVARALDRLARHQFPVKRSSPYRAMASVMARGWAEGFAFQSGVGQGWALSRLFRRSPGMARFLQTAGSQTLGPHVVTAGTKVNIVADRGEFLLDCRLLPGTTREAWIDELRRILGSKLADEFSIEITEWFPSNISGTDNPLWNSIENLFHEAHPDSRLAPLFIGGVTDGRFWRSRGATVYGFTLFSKALTMDAFGERIHGIDEKIDLESLALGVTFFSALPETFFSRYS